MISHHCVVLAGGLGTRILEITKGRVPKALIEVCGRPFIDFKIRSLLKMGFTSIDLLIGSQGEQIEDFVRSQNYGGSRIRMFSDGSTLLGTGGSIRKIKSSLPECFWVTYGDTYVIADVRLIDSKIPDCAECIMVVLKNSNTIEPSNVKLNPDESAVVSYRKGAVDPTFEWIDYGLLRLSRSTFETSDLGDDLADLITYQIGRGNLRAEKTSEPFWDIGTPERLAQTEKEFRWRVAKGVL